MKAGSLDRRATILRRIEGAVDALNAPAITYTEVATVWCQRLDTRAYERTDSGKVYAVREAKFRMRFRELLATDRIVSEGRAYEITGIAEIGRRAGLEVMAEATE